MVFHFRLSLCNPSLPAYALCTHKVYLYLCCDHPGIFDFFLCLAWCKQACLLHSFKLLNFGARSLGAKRAISYIYFFRWQRNWFPCRFSSPEGYEFRHPRERNLFFYSILRRCNLKVHQMGRALPPSSTQFRFKYMSSYINMPFDKK